jgi:hypothetical protein
MKRTVFLIAAAGSVLTAFLFFQPASNNGGGLISPATTASPVASTSEQPVAFTSTDPSPQSMPTTKATSKPAPVINSGVTRKVTSNAPALKAKSPGVSNPPSIKGIKGIKGGGDDEGDDEGDDD